MFKKLFLTTFFTMCLCMLVSNDVFASQTDEDRTFSYSAKKEYITVSHSESYSGLTGWGVFIGTATVDGTSVTQTLQ